MKIIKRNGSEAEFDKNKIAVAIEKANNAVDEAYRITPLQIERIVESVVISCESLGRSPEVEEVQDMVERHLNKWGGNCFSYAALLGFLVREATGLQVTAYHGDTPGSAAPLVPHGWITVMQDGQQDDYDVELDKFTKYATSKCYKVLATESKLHLNGVGSNLY